MKKNIFSIVLVFVSCCFFSLWGVANWDDTIGTICPADAKICEDWTTLSRSWDNCEFPACPEEESCDDIYVPVCGKMITDCYDCPSEIKTFSNKCVLEQSNATFLYEWECKEDPVTCTEEYAPVCWIRYPDGDETGWVQYKTFSNRCYLDNYNIEGYKYSYNGECKLTDIKSNCVKYYDWCNTCSVDENWELTVCTEMYCIRHDTPRCLEYKNDDVCVSVWGRWPNASLGPNDPNAWKQCCAGLTLVAPKEAYDSDWTMWVWYWTICANIRDWVCDTRYENIFNSPNDCKEEPTVCTAEYSPVCWEVGECYYDDWCASSKKTFSNKCYLEKANASFLYEWECKESSEMIIKDANLSSNVSYAYNGSEVIVWVKAKITFTWDFDSSAVFYIDTNINSSSCKSGLKLVSPWVAVWSCSLRMSMDYIKPWTYNLNAKVLWYKWWTTTITIKWDQCGDIYAPVCGSIENCNYENTDGCVYNQKTFANKCMLEKAWAKYLYAWECKEEPRICDDTYAPVCWQPKAIWEPCEEWMVCAHDAEMVSEPKTYQNKCMLEKEWASFLYTGSCINISDRLKARLDIIVDNFQEKLDEEIDNTEEKVSILEDVIDKLNSLADSRPRYRALVGYIVMRFKQMINEYNNWGLDDILDVLDF